jgi:AcrR family transcriptional regulator
VSVATQRTRRRQHRAETRRQILDAAQRFLRERSFRELTVDALMATTEHSRTVFYRHFDDIPALVLALIDEVGAELVEQGDHWAESDRVSAAEARSRLAAFVDFYVRNGPLVHAVAEATHHDEEVESAYNGMVEGFIALTTRAVEQRIATGDLEPLDAEEVSRALIRMLNAYLDDALGRGRAADPERVLDVVATIWTRTLFPGAADA